MKQGDRSIGTAPRAPPPADAEAGSSSLARRADVRVGRALVRPPLRAIEGPGGSAVGEPRVIQVLLALADAHGDVLTRDDLLRLCWGGRIVGDDAINRAIAEVRRLALTTNAGFTVQTVPRVGYWLREDAAPGVGCDSGREDPPAAAAPPPVGRRGVLIAAGAAACVATAGIGSIWLTAHRGRQQHDDLLRHGKQAYAIGTPPGMAQARASFQAATDAMPESAAAWGWLSLALLDMHDSAEPAKRAALTQQCQETARRALALDRGEPGARTTLAVLGKGLDDWAAFEAELHAILAGHPAFTPALDCLTAFLQAVGRCRESWFLNERALALQPFSPTFLFRRAIKYWIFGRDDAADRTISRALELWPTHPLVWNMRLMIYAFTARPQAALAMLDDAANRPRGVTPAAIAMWRASLHALATRARSDIVAARAVLIGGARTAPGLAANAVMVLSALGEPDAAFSVAAGILIHRGPVQIRPATSAWRDLYSYDSWRSTQWLFTPATKALRADQRFVGLCRDMGYVDYWTQRGIWPDPFVRGALQSLAH